MNIEQVAKEVLLEISPATECIADAVEAIEFLRRCLAKLAAHQDVRPVAKVVDLVAPAFHRVIRRGFDIGELLYTQAQYLAAQQRTAEACANVCDAQIERLRQQLAEAQQEIADRKADCEECHDQDEATIESLREQLSVAASEILALRAANKECVEYFAESQKDLEEKVVEIHRLKLEHETAYKLVDYWQKKCAASQAGKDAEIKRLKANSVKRTHELLDGIIAQAASQLREQQLREALDAVQQVANRSDGIAGWHLNGNVASWDSILPEVEHALAIPQDTSALEAMIQKAGEVMREGCKKELRRLDYWYSADAIRALPGVTLGDLK